MLIRECCDLPIHFHPHNNFSAQLTILHVMANAGCDILDDCFAAYADGITTLLGVENKAPQILRLFYAVWKSTSELGYTPSNRRGYGDSVASMA